MSTVEEIEQTKTVDGHIETSKLEKKDLDRIKISFMNMAQHKERVEMVLNYSKKQLSRKLGNLSAELHTKF